MRSARELVSLFRGGGLADAIEPWMRFDRVDDVPFDKIAATGAKAVLFDLENTIIPPGRTVRRRRTDGHRARRGRPGCGRRGVERVGRLGRPGAGGRGHPGHRAGGEAGDATAFLEACRMVGVAPHEAVYVGDQVITDVLGSQRAGMRAVLVKPKYTKEFKSAKFQRARRQSRDTDGREPSDEEARRMRLLVTGAAGFIGSNFVRHWIAERPDDHIVAFDLLTYAGNEPNLADVRDRIVFVQGDIGEIGQVEKVIEAEEIDTIVNFAAESHNSYAVLDPARVLPDERDGDAERCSRPRASRDIGASITSRRARCTATSPLDTDEMFTEESPYRPRTPYNASKAAADHAVRAYHETYGLPVTITNCANNYGPYQFPEKVIPLFATNALDDKPLPLYASTQNRREWIHVLDHCRGIERVILDGRVGETYNIGTGVERSIEQIADGVLDALGKPSSLKTIVPDRPGHDRRYVLDWTKIKTELGWEPQVDFEEGLRDTVRWYAEHRAWWEPLRERRPVVEEDAWR